MAKLLILLACMAGLVAARVLDTRRTLEDRFGYRNPGMQVMGDRRFVLDPIAYMTGRELERQKFLLKVLENVHLPLPVTELRNIPDVFVADEGRYTGGIDVEMLHLIQLFQSGRLLGKQEKYTIANKEHVRQMIGLKRLLVRPTDWETFVQNVLCARNRVNGLLFVNALLLAVRERDDTRNLIVPGIYEILPELYLDRKTISTARNIDLNLLTTSTEYETRRPSLLDMIGRGGRTTLRKDYNFGRGGIGHGELYRPDVQENNFLRTEAFDTYDTSKLKLFTEDVGLKSFLHYMINDLCLKENELQKDARVQRPFLTNSEPYRTNVFDERLNNPLRPYGIDPRRQFPTPTFDDVVRREVIDDGRRTVDELNRWNDRPTTTNRRTNDLRSDWLVNSRMQENVMDELPTTPIDSDRLLHVNRKKLLALKAGNDNYNMRDRFLNLNIMDQRVPKDNVLIKQLDFICIKCIKERSVSVCRKCLEITPVEVLNNLGDACIICIEEQTERDCNRCQVRIEDSSVLYGDELTSHRFGKRYDNRNLIDEPRNNREHFLDVIYRRGIDDGRKTKPISDMDGRLNRGMGLNAQPMPTDLDVLRRLDDVCIKCIIERNAWECNKCKKLTIYEDLELLGKVCLTCIQYQSDKDCKKCELNIKSRDLEGLNKPLYTRPDGTRYGPRGKTIDDVWLGDTPYNHRITEGRKLKLYPDIGVDRPDHVELIKPDILLHNIKQTLARINMERLSLGLDNLETLNDNLPKGSYTSQTVYDEYLPVSEVLDDLNKLTLIVENAIQRKLNTVVYKPDIELDREIARTLMGREGEISIIDIITNIIKRTSGYQTQLQNLRDIGIDLNDTDILKVMRYLVKIIDKIRTKVLGSYKLEDLKTDGIFINDIIVDQLVTRVEDRIVDLKNLIEDKTQLTVAYQKQLTHKDFNIVIDVDSDRNRPVVVRTFLGPKPRNIDNILTSDELRTSFMLLDTKVVDLNIGRNVIKRKSKDLVWTSEDTTPLTKIYERVMLAERGGDTSMLLDDVITGQDCRFPHRLILPRGRVDGLDMELFVIITPVESESIVNVDAKLLCGMGVSVRGVDHRSLGFPLDRKIDDIRNIYSLNNVLSVDVKIYHEDDVSVY